MQRLKSYIFLQEAYSEDNNDLANEWDLFLYESMVEHTFKPDHKPLLIFLLSMMDSHILTEVADDVSQEDVAKLGKTTESFYVNGLPRNETIQQILYNHYFHDIARPWYNVNYHDPYIPLDFETRAVIENGAKLHALNESVIAYDYFNKCKEYVADQNIRIDGKEYVKEVAKNPVQRRITPISNTIKSGNLQGDNKKPHIDLDLHVKDSFVYLHNLSEFEAKVYANSRSNILGHDEPYSHKTWIWSRKQRTRHSFMEGQTVRINEPFQVVNERTGEMSNLMFPRDYARDGSGANTINCGCDVSYHNNSKGKVQNGESR